MLKDSKTNLDLFSNDSDNKKCMKWLKYKYYSNKKKCVAISDIREKRVYFETLSVSSVKRSLNRICRKFFTKRSSGYEKFLTDEEKRFYFDTDRSLVEVSDQEWLNIRQGPMIGPPGLECISTFNVLQIEQDMQLLELVTNVTTINKYALKNEEGEQIYYAIEDTDCCTLRTGNRRPFVDKYVNCG